MQQLNLFQQCDKYHMNNEIRERCQGTMTWQTPCPICSKIKHDRNVQNEINKKINKRNAHIRDREARKIKRKTDPVYRMQCNLRTRLKAFMRELKDITKHRLSKSKSIGCSHSELKQYIESKFKPGMTWENYSNKGWHIDHIKPLSLFDLTDPEEFKAANHYTNLQPLWSTTEVARANGDMKSIGNCNKWAKYNL